MTPEEVEIINSLVRRVGDLLGFKFDEEKAIEQETDWRYFAYLYNGSVRLSFEYDEYKKIKRWKISGIFPRYKGESLGPYGKRFSISVSGNKNIEKIAKDIKSRLLPEYLAEIAEAEIRLEKIIKYHKGMHESICKVARYLGLPEPEEGKEVIYPSYEKEIFGTRVYKIEADSENSVKFEISTSSEKAIRILEILKGE